MKIIIRGELCEPPSSIYCFRDITLYAHCFLKADVLLETKRKEKDSYYRWLKDNGAYDFVKDIIGTNEETGFLIGPKKGNFIIQKINYDNLNLIVGRLGRLRGI